MATPSKRAHLALETPDTTESSSDESDDDIGEEEEEEEVEVEEVHEANGAGNNSQDEIQVEFEARTPEECDFEGVKRLLEKAFRANERPVAINLTQLAEFIIAQRNVGSVITQSHNDHNDDDEELDDLTNEVFGLTTVIRLSTTDSLLAKQVKEHVVRLAKRSDQERLAAFFANSSHSVAMLISERIMNIPPQISVPLYETLFNEIRKAKAKNCPFHFTHFVLISKYLRKKNDAGSVVHVNAEEEMLTEESDMVLDVDMDGVSGESGSSSSGTENNDMMVDMAESEYNKLAKILVIRASKSEKILGRLKELFPL